MDLMVELKSTKSGFAIRRLDHFGINQDKFWSAAQESNLYGFPQNFLRVPRLPIPASRRWSEIKESNLYGLPHQFLKLTRLPVPANLRLKLGAVLSNVAFRSARSTDAFCPLGLGSPCCTLTAQDGRPPGNLTPLSASVALRIIRYTSGP